MGVQRRALAVGAAGLALLAVCLVAPGAAATEPVVPAAGAVTVEDGFQDVPGPMIEWAGDYVCGRAVRALPPLVGPSSNRTATKALQVVLWQGGFRPGPIDGRFGSRTRAAVRRFQADRNLVVDGSVGPRTWLALKNWHCRDWG